jgi:hypothetical protein
MENTMGYLLPIWIIGAPVVLAIADSILAPKTTRLNVDRFTSTPSPRSADLDYAARG